MLSIISTLGLGLLLFLEQAWTFKASDTVLIYTVSVIAFDVLTATVPGSVARLPVREIVLVRLGTYALLLAWVCFGSHGTQPVAEQTRAPEGTSHLFSGVFLAWIDPVLVNGYKNTLADVDLPPLHGSIKPKLVRTTALQAWDQRSKFFI